MVSSSDRNSPKSVEDFALAVAALVESDAAYQRLQSQICNWAVGLRSHIEKFDLWKEDRRCYFLEVVAADKRLQQPSIDGSPPPEDGLHWERWDCESHDGKPDDDKVSDAEAVLAALKNKNVLTEAFFCVSDEVKVRFWSRFGAAWKKKQKENIDSLNEELKQVRQELKKVANEQRGAKTQEARYHGNKKAMAADIVKLEGYEKRIKQLLAEEKESLKDRLKRAQEQSDCQPTIEASIEGWVPERFREDSAPDTRYPWPPPSDRDLFLNECYALLSGIHDNAARSRKLDPFMTDDSWRGANIYAVLKREIAKIGEEDKRYLEFLLAKALKQVKKDLRGIRDDIPLESKRRGRTAKPADVEARKKTRGRYSEFQRDYKKHGYSRGSIENFCRYAEEYLDDMPTVDPIEVRRLIDAHRKPQSASPIPSEE